MERPPQGLEASMEQHYVSRTPPEALDQKIVPETRGEILKLLTEEGWRQAKEAVLNFLSETPEGHNWFFRQTLLDMHDFDPDRFKNEVHLSENDWHDFRQSSRRNRWNVEYAAMVKKIDPNRFKKEKPLTDEELETAFQGLSLGAAVSNSINHRDLSVPVALKELAPEKFRTFLESKHFRERDWPEVKETLEWLEAHRTVDNYDERTIELVTLRGLLQDMKPADEPDFSMDRREFQVVQQELSKKLRITPAGFFKLATPASRLRVQ